MLDSLIRSLRIYRGNGNSSCSTNQMDGLRDLTQTVVHQELNLRLAMSGIGRDPDTSLGFLVKVNSPRASSSGSENSGTRKPDASIKRTSLVYNTYHQEQAQLDQNNSIVNSCSVLVAE